VTILESVSLGPNHGSPHSECSIHIYDPEPIHATPDALVEAIRMLPALSQIGILYHLGQNDSPRSVLDPTTPVPDGWETHELWMPDHLEEILGGLRGSVEVIDMDEREGF
jgi:hypothetical protein